MDVYYYDEEILLQANFLHQELLYLEREIDYAKKCGDTKEYATLMRLHLNAQKEFLKSVAIMEAENSKNDALTEFAAEYNNFYDNAPDIQKKAI